MTQTDANFTSRRTVLKTIPAAVVGSGVASGAPTTGWTAQQGSSADENDLEIVAAHDHESDEHLFEFSTTEVAAGWTTVTFDNKTDHTHFTFFARLPQEAIDAAEEANQSLLDFYVEQVTNPFQGIMDDLVGEDPRHDPELPEWFENVAPSGGTGLTSPETTSTTTIRLAPGEYIVECYVKEANDPYRDFHSYHGMIEHLTVTDDGAGEEPRPTLELSLSTGGISFEDPGRPGRHTVAVRIEDQHVYEHLLGHDVHLIRLDDATSLDDVDQWMNWMDPDGLLSDGTEPGTFLGGVQTILTQELLDGNGPVTAYVDVTLKPGAYAWVSEVPGPDEQGLLQPFSVGFEDEATIDPEFGYPTTDAGTIPGTLEPDHEVGLLVAPPSGDGQPPLLYFDPAGLHVDPGDIVQFTFMTPDHTVTAYHPGIGHERRVPEGAHPFSSPVMGPGAAWLYRFDQPGVYDVNCAPHHFLGMVMRLVVGDLAEEDLPDYVDTAEGVPTQEDLDGALNALSEENEDCEWPFVVPADVLGTDVLGPMTIQERGHVPFGAVADELGYEFDSPQEGDDGE